MGRRITVFSFRFLISSFAIYFLIAFGLIFSQSPQPLPATKGLDFSSLSEMHQTVESPLIQYKTRNGSSLSYRKFETGRDNAPLVVLLHGSGWHGGAYLQLAKALRPEADVVVPDLRGHGISPERRGDVDYIGQYEDDLFDLIKLNQKEGQKLILAGHSSGGGLVIRFAGGQYGKLLDGAMLIAPYLHHTAPTVRPNSGGWAHPLIRRIIGLSMLNTVGISFLNNYKIIQFNFPSSVLSGPLGHTATRSYSYRLNASFAPREDYLKDITALPNFLLVAGKDDEAFYANEYEPLMSSVSSKGMYKLLDGVSHLDVINSKNAHEAALSFVRGF